MTFLVFCCRCFIRLAFPLILGVVSAWASAAGSYTSAGNVDELARAFAGLSGANGDIDESLDPGASYRAVVGASWKAYQSRLGVPMSRWASAEIRYQGGGTVFYPFSGPDFATVGQLFPGAQRYVLVAIQHARQPPDPRRLAMERRQALYGQFANEWKRFGALGFFRTNDLDADVRNRVSGVGVTPILMAFAVRLGYRVVDVAPIAFQDAAGDFDWANVSGSMPWQSVRLVLSRDGRMSYLDYVQMDLSDKYLNTHEPLRRWLERMARQPVLLKAASHLPQRPNFTVIRDAILAGAPLIVQDETGIEYDRLTSVGEVVLYGRFVRPYKLFDRSSQQSLAAAYRDAGKTRELPFSFSYIKSAEQRSLQIVRRKPAMVTGQQKPDPRRG